ncbi:MAG: N-acetyl-D-Glu racemase DgcA [Geminicoccaceae bacterium]
MARRLTVRQETWPIRGAFTISRGSKTAADVVVVEIEEDGVVGRGECVPYARYQETIPTTLERIERLRPAIEAGLTRDELQAMLAPGAARNALDCALWDLAAKRTGTPVWKAAGLPEPQPLTTCYTLSLGTPEAMAAAAVAAGPRPLLKLKLDGEGDYERVAAVRAAAPEARLVADANEAWTPSLCVDLLPKLAELGVEMIEQPLPAADDAMLASIKRVVPICADESCHDSSTLGRLAGRYDAINIKLDKTGGLSEALALAAFAREMNFGIMVGCMLATSLAMAPALLLGRLARWVDLDGPLLLQKDREPGLAFEGSMVQPAPPQLWG